MSSSRRALSLRLTTPPPAADRAWSLAWSIRQLTCAGAYFAAGKLGLALAFINASASAVWPPAGIAVGALLVFGPRMWPAVATGAFLVNITTSGHVPSSIAIAAGNTLEGLAAWWLVSRWAAGRAAFERPVTTFKFALLAGALAPIVAASTGVVTLVAAGLAPPRDWMSIWLTWWLGDAVGTVVIAPLLVLWMTETPPAWNRTRAIETASVMAAIGALGWLVFGNSPAGARRYPLEFIPAVVLLWPAIRLGAREAATATALLSVVAVAGTLQGFGPFALESPNASLLLLQMFVGIIAVLMLAVASEVASRRSIEAEVRVLNESLEQRVLARTDELERLRDRLAEAQALAHIGSWEWHVAADTVWWSEELYRIYGIDPDQTITYARFLDRVHPADRDLVQGIVGRALADPRPFSFEHRIVRPDGTERVLHASGHVTLDAAGRPVRIVGTGHDITERKRADEERTQLIHEQAARHEAESANHAKDLFLAVLSHELRTPLNAALGWAHLLRDMPHDRLPHSQALDAVFRNLEAQVRLVSDLMDASHITLGTLRLELARVDIVAVTRDAIEMIRPTATTRGIGFAIDIDRARLYVNGDAGRLQQVICNVLNNAVKFSLNNACVRVRVRNDRGTVWIAVEDDGSGIPAEFLPHIFDRFRQANASTKRPHGGLGLGLAIARHLIEAQGGTISAANRGAGGAVFTISLPAIP
jgi:PAS domain S-box-containing protein